MTVVSRQSQVREGGESGTELRQSDVKLVLNLPHVQHSLPSPDAMYVQKEQTIHSIMCNTQYFPFCDVKYLSILY